MTNFCAFCIRGAWESYYEILVTVLAQIILCAPAPIRSANSERLGRKGVDFSPLVHLCGPMLGTIATVGGGQMYLVCEACSLQRCDVHCAGGPIYNEFRHT